MNITVYCGAKPGNDNIYMEEAKRLGAWMVSEGHTLIYGGGAVGMMGAVSNCMLDLGGKCIGVIPRFMVEREWLNVRLSDVVMTETMSERRDIMIEKGDAFMALPGGSGTLDEISEVICLAGLGKQNKPCILLNTGGYYEPLRIFYDSMVEKGFLDKKERGLIFFADTVENAGEIIHSFYGAN